MAKNELNIRKMIEGDQELQKALTRRKVWDSMVCGGWALKWSPLHLAACMGNTPLIKILVEEFETFVDVKQKFGTWFGTALLLAIYRNQCAAVKQLISYGANAELGGIHQNGQPIYSGLHYAQFLGDREQLLEVLPEKSPGLLTRYIHSL